MATSGTNGSSKLKGWEYPKKSGIKIRELMNSRGKDYYGISYRVTIPAKLTGSDRIIKQFKAKEDAEDWADKQYAGYVKSGQDFSELTDKQRKEATLAVQMAEKEGFNIIEVMNFALPRMKPEGGNITVNKLVAQMLSSKESRFERGDLREHTLKDFRMRSGKFVICFEGRNVSTVTTAEIKKWLLDLDLSARSIKNYRNTVGELFRYALQKEYIFKNPLKGFSDEENKLINGGNDYNEPEVLTITEAKKLLTIARKHEDIGFLPTVTIGLFCGVRTEELKRMEWHEVRLNEETPFVSIPSTKAKKRRIRHVEIPDNGLAWLKICNNRKGKIAPFRDDKEFDNRFKRLLQLAGWMHKNEDGKIRSSWKKNCMRHSFGSYDYALHGDPIRTARLLGHKSNDDVLFNHYRALATKAKAQKYFSIKPS